MKTAGSQEKPRWRARWVAGWNPLPQRGCASAPKRTAARTLRENAASLEPAPSAPSPAGDESAPEPGRQGLVAPEPRCRPGRAREFPRQHRGPPRWLWPVASWQSLSSPDREEWASSPTLHCLSRCARWVQKARSRGERVDARPDRCRLCRQKFPGHRELSLSGAKPG